MAPITLIEPKTKLQQEFHKIILLNPDTRNSSLLFLVDVNALSYASDSLIMSNSMSKDQSICQKLMSG